MWRRRQALDDKEKLVWAGSRQHPDYIVWLVITASHATVLLRDKKKPYLSI